MSTIHKGQHIKVQWADGSENEYCVAEDSNGTAVVVCHRWIAGKGYYAPWTAKVPRKFITHVAPEAFIDNYVKEPPDHERR